MSPPPGNLVHSTYHEKSSSPSAPITEVININSSKKEAANQKPDEIFEIFGLKLYFDDLLILGLLFFLYTEGVKDHWLFLSLILLLLS